MKKILILTLLSISFSINSQWLLQTSQFNKPVSKIYFHDNSKGWLTVSGSFFSASTGNFAISTNGGTNWNIILNGCTAFNDFQFIDAFTGWLMGSCTSDVYPYTISYLLKTTNGGNNFMYQKVDTGKSYSSISFINENTGWIGSIQSLLFKTTNSGNTFIIVNDSISIPNYRKLFFKNENTGYNINIAGIFKTYNSGTNWNYKYSINGSNYLNTLFFVNDSIGYSCGSNGKIVKTTNSGENWFQLISPTTFSLHSLYFINETTGFIVGGLPNTRIIIYTTNGGNNWTLFETVNNYMLKSVFFLDSNTGWIAGGNSPVLNDIGVVYKTTNGGITGFNNISSEIPNQFSLSQNYPNPFNPSTKIKFQIPKSSSVAQTFLYVYDVLGREIETLVNQRLRPSTYEVEWDASAYPSGVYFYKLSSGVFVETRKMVLLK